MTRKNVADDQYGQLCRRLGEVARRVDEGSVPFDTAMKSLQLIIENETVVGGRVSTPIFANDKTKDGWKLIENISRKITSANDLELVSFLKEKESSINGEEIVRRARVELDANYGQEDAEWLLEHQDEIPAEFQQYYLVFTGTIWQGSVGGRGVPFLYWSGERWCLDFDWLGSGWSSSGRLVRLRK